MNPFQAYLVYGPTVQTVSTQVRGVGPRRSPPISPTADTPHPPPVGGGRLVHDGPGPTDSEIDTPKPTVSKKQIDAGQAQVDELGSGRRQDRADGGAEKLTEPDLRCDSCHEWVPLQFGPPGTEVLLQRVCWTCLWKTPSRRSDRNHHA